MVFWLPRISCVCIETRKGISKGYTRAPISLTTMDAFPESFCEAVCLPSSFRGQTCTHTLMPGRGSFTVKVGSYLNFSHDGYDLYSGGNGMTSFLLAPHYYLHK